MRRLRRFSALLARPLIDCPATRPCARIDQGPGRRLRRLRRFSALLARPLIDCPATRPCARIDQGPGRRLRRLRRFSALLARPLIECRFLASAHCSHDDQACCTHKPGAIRQLPGEIRDQGDAAAPQPRSWNGQKCCTALSQRRPATPPASAGAIASSNFIRKQDGPQIPAVRRSRPSTSDRDRPPTFHGADRLYSALDPTAFRAANPSSLERVPPPRYRRRRRRPSSKGGRPRTSEWWESGSPPTEIWSSSDASRYE